MLTPMTRVMSTVQPRTEVKSVVRTEMLLVTPAMAQQYLDNMHPSQRPRNKNRVTLLAQMMQSNEWNEAPYTIDSIAFDVDGRLVNGSHRMKALVVYGKPLNFWVIRGVKTPEDQKLPDGDRPLVRSESFIHGFEKSDWAIAKYLAEYPGGTVATPQKIARMAQIIAPAIEALKRTIHRRGVPAPLRAAFCLEWLTSPEPDKIVKMWETFLALDFGGMSPSMRRLYIVAQQSQRGNIARNTLFAKTLYALSRPDAERLLERADDVKQIVDALLRQLK